MSKENRYAVLKRLPIQIERDHLVYQVQGKYIDTDEVPEWSGVIDMGKITGGLDQIELPECPDCRGQLHWAEAGTVPWTRECASCHSLFRIETWGKAARTLHLFGGWRRSKIKHQDGIEEAAYLLLGLPVMSLLLTLRDQLEQAQGPIMPREMIASLDEILVIARGDAQVRLRRETGDDSIMVPGLVSQITDDEVL
jgi:hypothetical protein